LNLNLPTLGGLVQHRIYPMQG